MTENIVTPPAKFASRLSGATSLFWPDKDVCVRLPRDFFCVNRQHAREQLNLMAEQFESHVAGQKSRVLKDAFAKRHVEGHGAGVGETPLLRGRCLRLGVFKNQADILYLERGLLNEENNFAVPGIEGYIPRPVACAAVFDPFVGDEVEDERDDERPQEMF